ncbi:MAG TPA: adenylate kinase [Aeromicrobium sp.]|nr:adenylate kinase [Aeromicrobium sp.]
MRLLFMGPPGAGKGTQAVRLSEKLGVAHVSTGDIFRANVSEQSELGQAAQRYMDAGEYVPDEVTNAMVRDRLGQGGAQVGFILDGYPRTLDQVDTLDSILTDLGTALDGVISLKVESEELIQRLFKRAETSGRADDSEQVIRHRQDVYTAETVPLLDVYRDRGLLIEIDGLGEVDEIAERISAALAKVKA